MFASFDEAGGKKYDFWPEIEGADLPASSTRFWFVACMRVTKGSQYACDELSKKPCFFWIKSSARRAFGECLGSKRRWKTWYSAISHGELRISFDPWISEWGNPPDILLLLASYGLRIMTAVSNNRVRQVLLTWIHRVWRANPGNWNI